MKTCHIAYLLSWFAIFDSMAHAVEFDRRVDFTFFLQKNEACIQATVSGSELKDTDLGMLKYYAQMNSINICFGGSQSHLTVQGVESFLQSLKVKEVGFFDCEDNLRLIFAVRRLLSLTRLKISVGKIDDSLIENLAAMGGRQEKIELALFSKESPDASILKKISEKLGSFQSIHVNNKDIIPNSK